MFVDVWMCWCVFLFEPSPRPGTVWTWDFCSKNVSNIANLNKNNFFKGLVYIYLYIFLLLLSLGWFCRLSCVAEYYNIPYLLAKSPSRQNLILYYTLDSGFCCWIFLVLLLLSGYIAGFNFSCMQDILQPYTHNGKRACNTLHRFA